MQKAIEDFVKVIEDEFAIRELSVLRAMKIWFVLPRTRSDCAMNYR
jgi:hypothetical protein